MKLKFISAILLLLLINSCCRKLKSKIHRHTIDTNLVHLRLYTYGGPPDQEYNNAEGTICEKWGIQIHSVAGCMVDDILKDSVAENNEIISEAIKNQFGRDWSEKFNHEIREEQVRQARLRKLIEAHASYVQKKLGEGDPYFFFHQKNNNDYIIEIVTFIPLDEYGELWKTDTLVGYSADLKMNKITLRGTHLP